MPTEANKTFIRELLDKYGVPVVILGYFLWKDYTFTENVVRLMERVDSLMTQIQPLLQK